MLKRLLFCFFILQAGLLQAQWTTVIDRTDKMYFRQVVFPDDLHGYIIGDRVTSTGSFILKTIDGGLSWDTISIPVPYLSYIHMISADKGYLYKSGSPNMIVYTEDGFDTFSSPAMAMDSCFSILGVGTINDSTGFHLLNEGRLHKFTNYATGFSNVWTGSSFISFPSNTVGYACNNDVLLRTTNSGTSWDTVSTMPVNAYSGKFTSVNTGYILGTEFYRTIDGGINFNMVSTMTAATFAVRGNYCMLISDMGNVELSGNTGNTWVAETTGMPDIDIYDGAITPSGKAWLVSQFSGKVMTRSGTLALPETSTTEFSLYPNPARDMVNIQMKNTDGLTTCTLRNHLGQCISVENFSGATHQITTGNLSPGVYLVTLTGAQHAGTTKLVIEK